MYAYIYEEVEKLVQRFHTRDPFKILEARHVHVFESDRYRDLKGYCFSSCRSVYVMINAHLSPEEKRIVAAHELGHTVLHTKALQLAPMKDSVLYDMVDRTEYEANLFAADLLLDDQAIAERSRDEDLSYFSLCSSLYTTPELMSFKLYSLIQRGFSYCLPLMPDSRFLGKKPAVSDLSAKK